MNDVKKNYDTPDTKWTENNKNTPEAKNPSN